MKKLNKKLLSLILSAAMLMSAIPASASDITDIDEAGGNEYSIETENSGMDTALSAEDVNAEDTPSGQEEENEVEASVSVPEEGNGTADEAGEKSEEPEGSAVSEGPAASEDVSGEEADMPVEDTEPAAETEAEVGSAEEAEDIVIFEERSGSTLVRVQAPAGTFPEGTTMKVTALTKERTNEIVTSAVMADGLTEDDSFTVKKAVGFDITFMHEGNEIEPDGEVTVEFIGKNISDDAAVAHVNDNENVELLDVEKGEDGIVVTTDAFSEYVVYEADREDLDDIYADKSINLSTIGNVVQDIPKYNDGSKTTIFINTVYDREPIVTVHDNRFKEYRNHGTNTGIDGRDNDKYYLIEYDALPAGTTQFNNVLTVETPGIAYTADGTEVDLVYNLDWVQLQKVAGSTSASVNDSNGYYNGHDYYVGVAATGRPGNAFDLVHAHSRSGPLETFLDGGNSKANVLVNVKEKWTVSAYIAGTKTLVPNGILYTQFRDIDIVKSDGSQYETENPRILESKRLPEAIYFADGWKNAWLDSTSNLAHENNGAYVATQETDASIEAELRTSAVGVASDSPRVTFYWTGSRCDTTVSFGSYDKFSPVNGYPKKTVNKTEAAIGDTVTYTIKQAYPKVDDVSHFVKEAYVSDTFDEALDMNSFTFTVKNREGKDASGIWDVQKNGQSVKFVLKESGFEQAIGEEYTFTVSLKIKDMDYTGHINIADKLKTKQIPASYVKDGSTYAQIPNRSFSHIVDYNGNIYDGYSKYVTTSIPVDSISLTKDVDKESIPQAKTGDVLNYSFVIKNDGHCRLNNVQLEDALAGIEDVRIDWNSSTDASTGEGILSVGESVNATAKYRIKEGFLNDVAEKLPYTLVNTATAKGTDDNGNTVTDTDDAKTVINDVWLASWVPSISLTKTADKTNIPGAKDGDVINYTFEIKNDGTVELRNVELKDSLPGIRNLVINWTGSSDPATGEGVLSKGETVKASASYVISQADINKGSVVNPATVSGVDKQGTVVTDDDKATTILSQTAAISVDKVVDKTKIKNAKPGDEVHYTITITNIGNADVKDVVVDDKMLADAGVDLPVTWPAGKTAALAPGEKATASATYKLTQKDIDAGSVTNTVIVTAKDPGNKPVGPVDDTVKTTIINARIGITKTVDKEVIENPAAGDKLTYTIEITNESNVAVTDVALTDEMLAKAGTEISIAWPGEEGVLKVGEKAVATAVYSITQADIDAGMVDNVAVATAKDPDGDTVGPVDDDAKTELKQAPALDVEKVVDKKKIKNANVGDELLYTVTAVNTGNVTLHNVRFTDKMLSDAGIELSVTWPAGKEAVLAPGEKASATAVYHLTEKDIEAGEVVNVVIVNADDPKNEPVPPETDKTTTKISNPGLAIEKSVDKALLKNVLPGDQDARLVYDIVLANTGNVDLKNVVLTDEMLENAGVVLNITWPGEEGVLKVGESATAEAEYAVSQDDIENGKVINAVSAAAEDPDGDPVGPVEDDVETKIENEPAAELIKTADVKKIKDAKPGMVIHYTITGRNTGYTVLRNVAITDELEGISELAFTWPGEEGVLNPGEEVVVKASYAIKQEDINRGYVKNTALMTDPDVEVPPAETTTDLEQKPAVSIIKTTDEVILMDASAGDIVTWHFIGENTGNVDLHDVDITDELEGISELTYTWPGEEGVLKVGEVVTAEAKYVLTQDDIDTERRILNVAVITGFGPSDPDNEDPVTDRDTAETTPVAKPGMAIQKDVDQALIEDGKAGDKVTYTFTITNTGNTTLYDVTMKDAMLDNVSDIVLDWKTAKAEGVMLPGQVVKGSAVYKLTQKDIDAGDLLNVAVLSAKDPNGDPVDPVDDDAKTKITQHPELTVRKTVDKDYIKDGRAGDEVEYTIVVANTGNVTLHNVALTDEMLADAGVDLSVVWPTDMDAVLAPGEKASVAAVYVLTQEDIDRGFVTNVVIANADDPNGDPVPPVDDEVRTDIEQNPEIAVEKTVDREFIENGMAGDKVHYTFTVTNTGNVTVRNVRLTDEMLADAGVDVRLVFPEGREMNLFPAGKTNYLLPGEEATAEAEYALTQEDVDRGEIVNVVIANADDPNGDPVPPVDDEVRTDIEQNPEIAVEKTVDKEFIENGMAGDEVEYTVTVTNTGNVTVHNVTLTDEMLADAGIELPVTWPEGKDAVLAPGEKASAKAVYVLTQEDVDRGEIVNVVIANADDPNGDPVPPVDDEVKTEIEQNPSLVLEKDVDIKSLKDPEIGQALTYTVTVTNNGNVTIKDIVVTDKLLEYAGIVLTFSWPEGKTAELAPGESAVAGAVYSITQADIDRGGVNNTVIASGKDPHDGPVDPEPAAVRTEIERTSGLAVTKEVDKKNIDNAKPGDKLTYTFTITNTGKTTLVDVALNDDLEGLSKITYNWKDFDSSVKREFVLDKEHLVYHFACDEIADISTEDIEFFYGTIDEVKAMEEPIGAYYGTIEDVEKMGYVACKTCNPDSHEGVLLPGETVTATATYSITDADIRRGRVNNTVFATGNIATNDPGKTPEPVRSNTAKVTTTLHAPKTPKTGDTSNVFVWSMLLAIAAAGAYALYIKKKSSAR